MAWAFEGHYCRALSWFPFLVWYGGWWYWARMRHFSELLIRYVTLGSPIWGVNFNCDIWALHMVGWMKHTVFVHVLGVPRWKSPFPGSSALEWNHWSKSSCDPFGYMPIRRFSWSYNMSIVSSTRLWISRWEHRQLDLKDARTLRLPLLYCSMNSISSSHPSSCCLDSGNPVVSSPTCHRSNTPTKLTIHSTHPLQSCRIQALKVLEIPIPVLAVWLSDLGSQISVVQHVRLRFQEVYLLQSTRHLCLRIDYISEGDGPGIETCEDRGYKGQDAGDIGCNWQSIVVRHPSCTSSDEIWRESPSSLTRGDFWLYGIMQTAGWPDRSSRGTATPLSPCDRRICTGHPSPYHFSFVTLPIT